MTLFEMMLTLSQSQRDAILLEHEEEERHRKAMDDQISEWYKRKDLIKHKSTGD